MIKDIGSYTFNETINKQKGLKIIKHWEEIFKTLPEERQKKINASIHDPLLSLKKICKGNDNYNSVKYVFSRSAKTLGRLFAKTSSLQNLPREFRGALAQGLYHDLDISNAHPTFLYQYCKSKGFKSDFLEYYINNRDEVVHNISNKFNLSSGDVKNLILTLINGGKRQGLIAMDDYLLNLYNELIIITDNVILNNPKLEKQAKRVHKNDPNIRGKIVNLLLCNIENETMLCAVDYFLENGYDVDVLVFDGFMVKINNAKPITEDLLVNVSKHVLENTNYNIKLIEKPLDNSINELIKKFDDVIGLELEPTYNKMKLEFEKTHFKTLYPALFISIVDGREIIQKKDSFIQSYETIYTTVIVPHLRSGLPILQKVQFIKMWVVDENIRCYDKLDFYPNVNDCPTNHYNLFKGVKAEKYPPIEDKSTIDTLIEPIINHFKVLAQDEYMFILIYLAHILQFPNKKTKVNIVIAGKDGTGKSMPFDFFREMILGEDLSAQTDNTDDLFGQFSNILVEKLFLQVDEICSEDFKHKKSERLKNMITSKTIKLEKKGVDAITINNYSNSVMTTNNDFTIPLSQTDRRHFFAKAQDTYIQNSEYFTNLSNIFKKENVARAFYEYLLNLKIADNYDEDEGLQQLRPSSSFYKETKMMNLPLIYRFLSYLCSYNKYCNDDDSYITDDFMMVNSRKFYDIYTNWFKDCNFNFNVCSIQKFGRDISGISLIDKKRGKYGINYSFDKIKLLEFLVTNHLFDEYV